MGPALPVGLLKRKEDRKGASWDVARALYPAKAAAGGSQFSDAGLPSDRLLKYYNIFLLYNIITAYYCIFLSPLFLIHF